jgi:hypothetical protein
MMPLALSVALCVSSAGESGELTPDKVAQIRADRDKAYAEIDKKYGGRKPAELTAADQRAREQARSAASLEVIKKAGTDDKTFSRYEATMSRDEHAAELKAEAKLKQTPATESEPEITYGNDSNEPVITEGAAGAQMKSAKKAAAKKASPKKRSRK